MRQLVLVCVALTIWILSFGNPVAAPMADPVSKIPLLGQMAKKAAALGNIRVIVQLAVPDIKTLTAVSAQFKAGQSNVVAINRAASADAALAKRIATTAENLLSLTGSAGVQVMRRYNTLPMLALDLSPEALLELAQDPRVLEISEDHLAHPLLDDTVNLIGASDSWSNAITGAGWHVAILDTGIRASHDMFTGKSLVEACFSAGNDCPNNDISMTGSGAAAHHPSTYYGWDHGTHVAGIAAGDNGATLFGVAKDAGIIAVQVFSRFNNPGLCGANNPCVLTYSSDVIAGLDYIYSIRLDHDIAAVNLSLGSGYHTGACDLIYMTYKTAIDQLRSVGIATVVASGNENYCDGISAPGCVSTAITVGATTNADIMTSFSNYHATLVDLFAPGMGIYSAVGDSDSTYGYWSGTSMATPHVTGAFALLRQANAMSSMSDMEDALLDSGEPAEDSANCGDSGTLPIPRIAVNEAVSLIAVAPDAPDGLAASAGNWNAINLSWNDNASNEFGFKIYRKTGAGGIYSEIARVVANITSYTDSNALSEGTTYVYQVLAYNDIGDSDASAEADDTTLLAPPGTLAAAAFSETQIDLTWTDNSTVETGFQVERRTNDTAFVQIATLGADMENYSDTGLTAATRYHYQIRSFNGSVASLYSQISAKTGGGGGGSGGGCFLSNLFQ